MAKLQDPLPNARFRLMCRDALSGRPGHIGFQVMQGEFQCILVAIATGLRHALHHEAPLVCGVALCFLPHFDIGERMFPHRIPLSPRISKGDAQRADESVRPVTPSSEVRIAYNSRCCSSAMCWMPVSAPSMLSASLRA